MDPRARSYFRDGLILTFFEARRKPYRCAFQVEGSIAAKTARPSWLRLNRLFQWKSSIWWAGALGNWSA